MWIEGACSKMYSIYLHFFPSQNQYTSYYNAARASYKEGTGTVLQNRWLLSACNAVMVTRCVDVCVRVCCVWCVFVCVCVCVCVIYSRYIFPSKFASLQPQVSRKKIEYVSLKHVYIFEYIPVYFYKTWWGRRENNAMCSNTCLSTPQKE